MKEMSSKIFNSSSNKQNQPKEKPKDESKWGWLPWVTLATLGVIGGIKLLSK